MGIMKGYGEKPGDWYKDWVTDPRIKVERVSKENKKRQRAHARQTSRREIRKELREVEHEREDHGD